MPRAPQMHMDMDPALRVPCLPGVNLASVPYRPVSFAAEREYGPDEGWTRVVRHKKKAHRRREQQSS